MEKKQEIKDRGNDFASKKNANYPFMDYDEEIRFEIAKEKETALNDLKNLKFIFPKKQNYQPIVINTFSPGKMTSNHSLAERSTLSFDRILAIALLEKCDIKTISRMRLLSTWWNSIIINNLDKVWRVELNILQTYFKIPFTSSTSSIISFVPNKHDNIIIQEVMNILCDTKISPYVAVSKCYSTIRHFELKNGRIKYILVEPNPHHIFDKGIEEIGNVTYDLKFSDNLFTSHFGLYDSFNTNFPHMNIASVGSYIIDNNLENYDDTEAEYIFPNDIGAEHLLANYDGEAFVPAGHFIGINTNS